MKMLSLIMAFLLIPQFAFASNAEALKNLIDDYQYSVTVEWDQQDQDYLKEKNEKFSMDLKTLMAKGLNQKDLAEVFPEIEFDKLEQEYLQTHLSPEEVVKEFLVRNNYGHQKGLSWMSEGGAMGICVLFMIGVIVLAAVYPSFDGQSK